MLRAFWQRWAARSATGARTPVAITWPARSDWATRGCASSISRSGRTSRSKILAGAAGWSATARSTTPPSSARATPNYPFRSQSDVETILPLYLDRGLDGLADLDGMFGLAIWEEASRSLVPARDRAGEKPLFYTRIGGEIWFASEVQALLPDPRISRDLDETAVFRYLALGYVPEPRTAFREIRKIEAGTIVRFAQEGVCVSRYWDPAAVACSTERSPPSLPRLRSLLTSAVRKQLIADVPMGVFVSGGVDSGLIASIAAEETSGERFHTFNARFVEASYDESPWGGGLQPPDRRPPPRGYDRRELAGRGPGGGDPRLAEPLADPAVLPTYLVAREARRHVTVVLSGEGADELFGGYPTYLGHKLVPGLQALPSSARDLLRTAAGLLPASRGKVTLEFLVKRFLADAEKPWHERHLAWFGVGAQSLMALNGRPASSPVLPPPGPPGGVSGAMLLDYRTYLPDFLLVKSDRATMLNSLEARAPFLDRDLSAFAFALPETMKVRGLTTKWLLKRAAQEWLPRRFIHRRKRGLSVPIAIWLDRGLRTEVDRLLAAERLARQELFDPGAVGRLLAEHRSRKANHARPLWTLVVFQYWLERWLPERAGNGCGAG